MKEINSVTIDNNVENRETVDVFFNNHLTLASVIAQRHDGFMKGAYYTMPNANKGTKGEVNKVYLSNGRDFSIHLNDLMGQGISTHWLYPDHFDDFYHVFCYPVYDLFDAFGIKETQKTIYFDMVTGKGYECSVYFYLENYGKRFLVTFKDGEKKYLTSHEYGKEFVFLDGDRFLIK